MRICRMLMALALYSTSLLASIASASSGTNFTDQWWNPDEPGWGASVLQQGDVLFIDLFVYDASRQPVWYTAAAYFQPTTQGTLFTGDLYRSTGTPFFLNPYNPSAFASDKVGTIAFNASSTDVATLSYTVDTANIIKSVQRQLWRYEDFTGSYYGGLVYDQSACGDPGSNGHVEELGAFQINHSATNAITITLQSGAGNCTFNGNYSQLGHMGTVDASYTCAYGANGVNGTVTFYELERTSAGMTGRFVAQNNACDASGMLGGVQR
jgi:hypothetical protein